MRTPLAHTNGAEHRRGDDKVARRLSEILRLTKTEHEAATTGVHRLHAYPGRMHPVWAQRAIADVIEEQGQDRVSILDPFCGSGTVLVEARRMGVYSRGSDINPIALRLARLKCIPPPDPAAVIAEAERCAANCGARRQTRFSALASTDKESFPPHVLAAQISLRDEIEQTQDKRVKEALLLAFSPGLDKFGARHDRQAPRVPRTAVRDHFLERVADWVAFWKAFEGKNWAEVEHADARWLPWKPHSSSCLITSPPYPGVLDYGQIQARRLRWIGDCSTSDWVRKTEIGRRGMASTWTEGMQFALRQAVRTLRPNSPMYLVVGDGVSQKTALRVDEIIEDLIADLPATLVAVASQERPHFHRPTAHLFAKRARLEHLILLRRTSGDIPRDR